MVDSSATTGIPDAREDATSSVMRSNRESKEDRSCGAVPGKGAGDDGGEEVEEDESWRRIPGKMLQGVVVKGFATRSRVCGDARIRMAADPKRNFMAERRFGRSKQS